MMTFTTPSGKPTSRASSAKRIAVSGVALAGFMITVFPAASAGAVCQIAMASG